MRDRYSHNRIPQDPFEGELVGMLRGRPIPRLDIITMEQAEGMVIQFDISGSPSMPVYELCLAGAWMEGPYR